MKILLVMFPNYILINIGPKFIFYYLHQPDLIKLYFYVCYTIILMGLLQFLVENTGLTTHGIQNTVIGRVIQHVSQYQQQRYLWVNKHQSFANVFVEYMFHVKLVEFQRVGAVFGILCFLVKGTVFVPLFIGLPMTKYTDIQ